MKQLVCIGKEYVFRGDDKPELVTQLADLPRQPQKARVIKREYMALVSALRAKHNGYRPAPFLQLADDQCRYTVHGKTMCGAKVAGLRRSWCDHHAFIVRHGSKALEAAE